MKKLKIIFLALVVSVGAMLFSACTTKKVVNVKSIELEDTEITLKIGTIKTISVAITPDNATKKDFEVVCLNNIVTVEVNLAENNFVIKAPNSLGQSTTDVLSVKTLDGSKLEAHLTVNITNKDATIMNAPQNLTFNESTESLVWDSSENYGYEVCINDAKQIVHTNTYFVDLKSLAGSDVVCKVKALGQSSSFDSAYAQFNFKVLSAPKNLVFSSVEGESGTTYNLQWGAIDGATKYQVYVDGVIASVETTTYSIKNTFETAKNYQIKVKAVGSDDSTIISSAYSEGLTVTRLDSPVVVFKNGVASWSTVLGAKKYNVSVYDKNDSKILESNKLTETTFSVIQNDFDAGNYKMIVVAKGDGSLILDSANSASISFEKLSCPVNLRVENDLVVWDSVAKATSYIPYLNGNEVSQTGGYKTNKFSFDSNEAGTYKICVVANGESNTTISSEKSVEFTVTKLSVPTALKIIKNTTGNFITWNTVQFAKEYEVVIASDANFNNIVFNATVNENTCKLQSDLANGKNYYVKVKSSAKNSVESEDAFISSKYCNAITLVKYNAVSDFIVSGNTVSWTKPTSNIAGYAVEIFDQNGNIVKSIALQTANNYSFENYSSTDIYSLRVKVVSSPNENSLDSDFSNSIQVQKIKSPTLTVEGGRIVVDNSTETIRYSVDGKEKAENLSTIVSNLTQNQKYVFSAKALAEGKKSGEIYLLDSEISNNLLIKILPKIEDISLSGDLIKYGANYASLNFGNSGYSFQIEIDDETVDNSTYTSYSVAGKEAGSYSVYIWVKGLQTGKNVDENTPLLLNSVTSNVFNFEKLAVPQNLAVTSFADGENSNLQTLISSLANCNPLSSSGVLTWDAVENAILYRLTFDGDASSTITTNQTMVNLQQSSILAGAHTVAVSAIGKSGETIASANSESINFVKLTAPQNVRVENGYIKWDYTQNINNGIGGLPMWITDKSKNATTFIMVVGKSYYLTLDLTNFDVTKLTDMLKANKAEFPDINQTSCELKIYAIPFNAYVSSLNTSDIGSSSVAKTEQLCVLSDFSNTINLKKLDTPLGLNIKKDGDDEILNWSPLLNETGTLKAYQISINQGEDNWTFFVSTTNSDTLYEKPNIYVSDLSTVANCKWVFSKANFEKMFGTGTYVTGEYSFAIKALSNTDAHFVDDVGKVYYWTNSYFSTAINVTVLKQPIITVYKGEIVWTGDDSAQGYMLSINGKEIKFDKDTLIYTLDKTFAAGNYECKVMTLGDGTATISSEYGESKTFVKLEKISNLQISNGIIKYDENNVVALNDNDCYYTLFIDSSNGKQTVDNQKYIAYELTDETKFPGGLNYNISIKAFGDDKKYLNSDVSEIIAAQKFPNLGTIRIENGQLKWNEVGANQYKITISGGVYNYSTTTITNTFDFQTINGSEIASGVYAVEVKALGNTTILNSSISTLKELTKLQNISGIKMNNGVLVWDNSVGAVASNYNVYIKLAGSDSYKLVETAKNQFQLDGNYGVGQYSVYIFNNGGNRAISSKKSDVYSIEKLPAPTELKLNSDETGNNLSFKANKRESNLFNLKIGDYILDISSYLTYNSENGTFNINLTTFLSDNGSLKLSTSGTYDIAVCEVGSTTQQNMNTSTSYLATSEFSATLTIKKPTAPTGLNYAVDSSLNATGKIYWNKVENVDYYIVYFKQDDTHKTSIITSMYKDINNISNFVKTENVNIKGILYTTYKLTSDFNYCFVNENGLFNVCVVAGLNADGFDSDMSASIEFNFGLFSGGNGTAENPYQIVSINDFNKIKYNMYANYQLQNDIDFGDSNFETIGSTDEYFYGTLSGKLIEGEVAKSIKNITITDSSFSGIFAVIGNGAVVKDLIYDRILVGFGAISCGIVASQNYGQIDNCVIINSEITLVQNQSEKLYVGGIVAKNYGKMSNCSSSTIVAPSNNQNYIYAGGICAYNDSIATITNCHSTSKNISGNISGGIAGENSGLIEKCYFGNTIGSASDSFVYSKLKIIAETYAGGIAGTSNGKISTCYSIGHVSATSGSRNSSAYAGGIVGKLEKTTANTNNAISNCYAYAVNASLESLITVDFGNANALVAKYTDGMYIPTNNRVVVKEQVAGQAWGQIVVTTQDFDSAKTKIVTYLGTYYKLDNTDHPIFK